MPPTSPPPAGSLEAPSPGPSAEGLRGVQVSESRVSLVDGVNGRLLYRGYDIQALADRSTFEETSYLLLYGNLPKKPELRAFTQRLAVERRLPNPLVRVLRSLPTDVHPMDALRTAVSYLGAHDPDANDTSPEARQRVVARLVARMASAVATFHRIRTGQGIVPARRSGGHAQNFLRMLTGDEPDEFSTRAIDVALILHADHEFNASTFSGRVTASTLSDIYSAVTSAIGTLKGPLHGGANRAVMEQLRQVGDLSHVDAWVRTQLASHEKIMGFGHAVYRTMDPRATVLRKLSEEAGRRANNLKWYELSTRMQDVVHQQKGLWPNVDFYSASLYHVMGIPDDLFPCMFAMSRISGWLAHILEQYDNNKLIRPLSHYVGSPLREYVPLTKRA